jgi:peptidoglycan/LPS O-acetylase OafA/YrhL
MPTDLAPPGYRPDIQGLRAVAVLAVLGYHAGLPLFGGGYLGVDVFFVISGYLIGGQLLRELRSSERIRFAGFYARRARRILPASLTVIAATVIAAWFLCPPLRLPGIATDGIWAALSAANIRFAIEGTDYLSGPTPSPLQHYWSLGVEEQFYLVVPLLLIALFAVVRTRTALLAIIGIAVTVGSFAICLAWGPSSPWTYFTLPARAWELGVGVMAAGVAGVIARLPRRWRAFVSWLGAGGLLVTAWAGGLAAYPHPGAGTVLPVLATAAIILGGGVADPQGSGIPIVNRALGIRPARFVGALSFSLYLVHWPVLALAQENSNSETPLPLAARAALAALSVPLAWVLWRYIEQPALRARVDAGYARRRLGIAAVTIAALVASLMVATPALAARPLASDRPAPPGAVWQPEGTDYVPSNLSPALADAAADTGELYRSGCQQGTSESALKVCSFGPDDGATVVLFGDSHAGRWFPALQSAFDGKPVRLISLTKSGCRSLESASLWAGADNRSCAQWRASALDWLTQHPPDLLVLANHLGRSTGSPSASQQHWHDATVSTLTRLPHGVPVAILGETPEFDFSPPVCLSRHLNDALACSEPRAAAVDRADLDGVRSGAAESSATFVDLTDWFCNATDCPTIIGSSLVYTDEHHLAATFSAQLGAPIAKRLGPLIARSEVRG